jgi:hypothetical protein
MCYAWNLDAVMNGTRERGALQWQRGKRGRVLTCHSYSLGIRKLYCVVLMAAYAIMGMQHEEMHCNCAARP